MRPAVLDVLRCPRTGGPLDVDVLDEGPDGAVEHGVLHSEAGAYPVVAGIPVLREGTRELVDLVRAGSYDLAAQRAAFGEIGPSGWRRTGAWLAATDRMRPVGRRILDRHQQDLDARSAALVDPQTGVRDLFALAYQDLHLRNPEVFAYNWYRFGLPRHLAALAALEWAPTGGPVLDVGCGAGHLTWALTEHTDAPVIGVDGLFFALYVAKTRIAPAADFVCGELESLPLADGTAGGIWASDVLHAVNRKVQVARELARVATEGSWGAVVGLAVAGHDHEYPGRPLSLEGYRRLLPDDATLVPDDALVDGYLQGRAASRADAGEGRMVTALWGDGNDGAPFTDWPHGRGERAVHPLLQPDGDTLRLTFPTASFEREHGALRRYTPAEAAVPHAPSPEEAERLVETFVLLGFPPGYQAGA